MDAAEAPVYCSGADEIVTSIVLAQPTRLARDGVQVHLIAFDGCLAAPRDVAKRCLARMNELEASNYFSIPPTALGSRWKRILERYVSGESEEAAMLARQTLQNELPASLRENLVRILDQVSDAELIGILDDKEVARQGKHLNGATLSHVRAARRAKERGDAERARSLANAVIEAWGTADTPVPAVAEMKRLLGEL